MAEWKKVHVEDANTSHTKINAQLTDIATNVTTGGARHLVIVENDGGAAQQDLKTQTFSFGNNAFNSTPIPAAANNATITLTAGNGLTGGDAFTTNQSANETITFNVNVDNSTVEINSDAVRVKANGIGANELNVSGNGTSGQMLTSDGDGTFSWVTPGGVADAHSGIVGPADVDNSNLAYVQDITFDAYGHVESVTSTSIPNASTTSSGVVTNAAQTLGGNKTFANDVIISGNLTVNGGTTTISTTELVVEDKIITLGDVDTPTVITGSGAGIQVETSASSAEWPEMKWINGSNLSGWKVSNHNATANTDYNVSVMDFGTAAPTGTPEAGAGLFFADTTNNDLYIYI